MNRRRSKLISGVLILSVLFFSITPYTTYASADSKQSNNKETPITFRDKDVKKLVELEEKRDQYTKHYLNDDGSYTAESTVQPRHFKDSKGKWQDISNKIVSSDDAEAAFKNEANSIQTSFAPITAARFLARVKLDNGKSLEWGVPDADKVSAEKDTYSVTYPNIFLDIDLNYQPTAEGLKENIILKTPDASNVFKMQLTTTVLKPEKQNDGSVALKDTKSDETTLVIPAPFMIDQNNQISKEVEYEITPTKNPNVFEFTVTADQNWLSDPVRSFPVTVDPTVKTSYDNPNIQQGVDTYVASGTPYSYWNSTYMTSGLDAALGYTRAFVRFPAPNVPAGAIVTDADFSIFTYYATLPSLAEQIDVHRVTSSWQYNITWSTQPTFDTEFVKTNVAAAQVGENAWKRIDFNVFSMVKGWVNGGLPNYGFMIRHDTESDPIYHYYSSNDSDPNHWPTLSITYITDQIGLNPYWSYANTLAGSVNTFNGNFISSVSDFALPGRGIPITVSRTYNSRGSLDGIFGQKWFSNLDMQLQSKPFGFVLIDSAGTERPFITRKDGSGYIAPNNYPLQLYNTTTNGAQTYTLQEAYIPPALTTIGDTVKDSLPSVIFDINGKVIQLRDGKGNTTTVTRNSGSITLQDASGRTVTLILSNGLVTQINDNQSNPKVV